MKLTELHDHDPLLIGVLRGLLKKGAHIHCDFSFKNDPNGEHALGELFDIEDWHEDSYTFRISGGGSVPIHVIVTPGIVEEMEFKHRSKDEYRDEWDLTYVEVE